MKVPLLFSAPLASCVHSASLRRALSQETMIGAPSTRQTGP